MAWRAEMLIDTASEGVQQRRLFHLIVGVSFIVTYIWNN
jgi:hypothetical protein